MGLKGFSFTVIPKKRILIAGSYDEIIRVYDLLTQSNIQPGFIGLVSVSNDVKFSEEGNDHASTNLNTKEYLGNISQLKDLSEVYKIDEVIFCARDIASTKIIDLMGDLENTDVDFKIAPPESLYIIGSNSINTTGDLYVIDINSITKPDNRRKKRTFDIVISGSLLMVSPVVLMMVKKRRQFLKNCFHVISGDSSWVGYTPESLADHHLPGIKKGILNPLDITEPGLHSNASRRLNIIYAKDYKVSNDLYILYKGFRNLGRK